MTYNYKHFSYSDYDFNAFSMDGPQMGEILPNFEALTISGETVNIRKYKGKTIVIEAGSITCPMYVNQVKPMLQLATEFDDVVFSEEVGKVHGPVQTQFGFHLIEITNRTE